MSHYILVGLIIEQVCGKPYYQLLNNRFLEPLGEWTVIAMQVNSDGADLETFSFKNLLLLT